MVHLVGQLTGSNQKLDYRVMPTGSLAPKHPRITQFGMGNPAAFCLPF
jgi:hypothetical protein